MKTRLAALSTLAIAAPLVALAGPAQAGPGHYTPSFANCTAMHRVYKHGVARSVKAAKYQVRTGHYRPAVRPAIYRANSKSDADKDGTACEVTD
jgi:excalibur calcium-binding domain-containing protein